MIVILVDTLRADRLGAYGSTAKLTPFLDELAARATVFRHAVATAPWTNPSVASLFTGVLPARHGITAFSSSLPPDLATLAELLKQHGYRTAAFVANGMLLPAQGWPRGFDQYKLYWKKEGDAAVKQRVDGITTDVTAWLDARPAAGASQPVFLYLHCMEPHAPYSPPADVLAAMYPGAEPDPQVASDASFFASTNPAEVAVMEQIYDAEVRAFDRDLRGLFAALEQRGVLDDAIVVLTADHGEQFLEHGHSGHANSLYGEEIDIPFLLLRTPRAEGRIVEEPVSLVDVPATVLDLAGAPVPPVFEGRSLAALAGGGTAAAVPVYAELVYGDEKAEREKRPHRIAMVAGERKVILHTTGAEEAYDLARDPAERQPDLLDASARTALRDALLASPPMRMLAAAGKMKAPPVDAETADRMRALGYVE